MQKALWFERIFTSLKQIKDPVAAEAIKKEFAARREIADEASASAEERAQLEELYAIRRTEAIKQAQESAVGQLKDLKTGDNSLNLRSRQQNILSTSSRRSRAGERSTRASSPRRRAPTSRSSARCKARSTSTSTPSPVSRTLPTRRSRTANRANVASLLSGNTQQAQLAAAAAAGGSAPTTGGFDVSGMVNAITSRTVALVDALNSTSAATNARLDLISRQLAQQGTPMLLQLGDAGGVARMNAVRNA